MTTGPPWSRIERLHAHHDISQFRTGLASVDEWFHSSALYENQAGRVSSRVCLDSDDKVLGFFALKMITVRLDSASRKIRDAAEQDRTAVACLVAQMGIHEDVQGQGHGRDLVRAVLSEASAAQDAAAFRFLVLDAENDGLLSFYTQFGFVQLPGELRMIMKMSVVRKILCSLEA